MEADPGDGLVAGMWLASAIAPPGLSRGHHQTFAYAISVGAAVMTTRLRPDELEPAVLLPALGSLIRSMGHRLAELRDDEHSAAPDLLRAENLTPQEFRSLRPRVDCLVIDGLPYLAHQWNLGSYRALITLVYPLWVSVIPPAGPESAGPVTLRTIGEP